ncbi:MAG: hypothetical protein ACI9TF_001093, partial [Paracrocinitomix sp.]
MSNKFARLIALLMALSLIAAACGSSSDGDSASDSDADTGSALSTDSDDEEEEVVAEAEEEAEEEAAEEEEAEEAEVVDESADNPAVAEVNGNSAGRFYDAINNPVGPADDSLEPVVITMSNMEGTPGVSFPEIREGFEIAVAQINNELGGINGRPIEFESCAHEFDP